MASDPDPFQGLAHSALWIICAAAGGVITKVIDKLLEWNRARMEQVGKEHDSQKQDRKDALQEWKDLCAQKQIDLDREQENLKATSAKFDEFRTTATNEIKTLNETINRLVLEKADLKANACDQIPTCIYRNDKTHPND